MDRAASVPLPCPGRVARASPTLELGPRTVGKGSMGPLRGRFSMPGLSEDNPSVQVIPTPTPLVPHFQMLLLDLLKVLQQLCVVDTGGICFLRLGDCLQTISGERK